MKQQQQTKIIKGLVQAWQSESIVLSFPIWWLYNELKVTLIEKAHKN